MTTRKRKGPESTDVNLDQLVSQRFLACRTPLQTNELASFFRSLGFVLTENEEREIEDEFYLQGSVRVVHLEEILELSNRIFLRLAKGRAKTSDEDTLDVFVSLGGNRDGSGCVDVAPLTQMLRSSVGCQLADDWENSVRAGSPDRSPDRIDEFELSSQGLAGPKPLATVTLNSLRSGLFAPVGLELEETTPATPRSMDYDVEAPTIDPPSHGPPPVDPRRRQSVSARLGPTFGDLFSGGVSARSKSSSEQDSAVDFRESSLASENVQHAQSSLVRKKAILAVEGHYERMKGILTPRTKHQLENAMANHVSVLNPGGGLLSQNSRPHLRLRTETTQLTKCSPPLMVLREARKERQSFRDLMNRVETKMTQLRLESAELREVSRKPPREQLELLRRRQHERRRQIQVSKSPDVLAAMRPSELRSRSAIEANRFISDIAAYVRNRERFASTVIDRHVARTNRITALQHMSKEHVAKPVNWALVVESSFHPPQKLTCTATTMEELLASVASVVVPLPPGSAVSALHCGGVGTTASQVATLSELEERLGGRTGVVRAVVASTWGMSNM